MPTKRAKGNPAVPHWVQIMTEQPRVHAGSSAFCKPCGYLGIERLPSEEYKAEQDLARHERTLKHQAMLRARKRPLRRARPKPRSW